MSPRSLKGVSLALLVLTVSACSGSNDGSTSPDTKGATQLVITVSPSNIIAGEQFARPVQVELRDAAGAVVTTSAQVSLALTGADAAGATITGNTTVNAVNGVASFPGITVTRFGFEYRLVASSGTLTSEPSGAFTVASGPATRLSFSIGPPNEVQGNVVITPALRVNVQDQYGNEAVAAAPVTMSLDQTPWPRTTLSGSLSRSGAGFASFSDLSVDRPGTGNVLRATTGNLTATSAPFTVRVSFKSVATGGWNSDGDGLSCGIATGGTYCWGSNGNGQIGARTADHSENVPFLVPTSATFVEVDGGGKHACGRVVNGTVACWGNGLSGQLGSGFMEPKATPFVVSGSGPSGLFFESISAGDDHTCGVVTGGSVYCWGSNAYGQLGDGFTTMRIAPVKVSGSGSGALVFTSVSAAVAFTCGTTTAQAVWCWGEGSSGHLGNPSSGSLTPVQVTGTGAGSMRFARVHSSFSHTCGVTVAPDAGKVYCWGGNLYGGLGNGATGGESSVPVLASSSQTFVSVSAGTNFTCALTTVGDVYCWGRNFDGEVGNGTFTNVAVPTRVSAPSGVRFGAVSSGGVHACAIANVGTTTGDIYCWGLNSDGRLGDGTTAKRASPTKVIQ